MNAVQLHPSTPRGCEEAPGSGWQDAGQQELGPRCSESDALTAHKTCTAANGRAANARLFVTDLPPHLLGASPQTQSSRPSCALHDLDANSHDHRHQPHSFNLRQLAREVYWVEERPSSRHSLWLILCPEPSRRHR